MTAQVEPAEAYRLARALCVLDALARRGQRLARALRLVSRGWPAETQRLARALRFSMVRTKPEANRHARRRRSPGKRIGGPITSDRSRPHAKTPDMCARAFRGPWVFLRRTGQSKNSRVPGRRGATIRELNLSMSDTNGASSAPREDPGLALRAIREWEPYC